MRDWSKSEVIVFSFDLRAPFGSESRLAAPIAFQLENPLAIDKVSFRRKIG